MISKTYTKLSRHPTTRFRPTTTTDENISPGICFSPTTAPLTEQSTEITPGTEQAKTRGQRAAHSVQATDAKHGEEKTGWPRPMSASQVTLTPLWHRTLLRKAAAERHQVGGKRSRTLTNNVFYTTLITTEAGGGGEGNGALIPAYI